MNSKQVFTEEYRKQAKQDDNALTNQCLYALELAESEIELLREKLHIAKIEIDSLSHLVNNHIKDEL